MRSSHLPFLTVAFALATAAALCADEPTPQKFPDIGKLPSIKGLPDPLTMFDGTPVQTPEDWYDKRRPELKRLFEHYMYGVAPPAPDKVLAKEERVNAKFLDGKATKKEVTISFGPKGTPPIHLLLILPNGKKAAPVFVAVNFQGNHAVWDDPTIALAKGWVYPNAKGVVNERATDAARGSQKDVWCVDYLVDRGYGLATFYSGDVDPDKNDFTDGVHPHYLKPGQKQPGPDEWGTIRAWAWGVSRVVDYLVTNPDIDKSRISVTGHSRLGKTALLAGAFDERIAIVCPHQSGTGGCALSRDNDQETVERINRVFPHWFNDIYPKFAGHEAKLPVDQNLLMALVAPRALFDTEGLQDKWANYNSGFRALESANSVWKFLGAKGIVGTGLVENDDPIVGPNFGDVMQYRLDSKHVLNQRYWQAILDFADKYFATRSEKKGE